MDKTKARFQEGLEAGKRRDYKRSAQIFSALVQEDIPEALLYLGRAYHGLGQYLEAVQVLGLYVKQTEGDSQGHFFYGRSLLALGLYQKAAAQLEKARHLGFPSDQVLGLLGNAYLKARDIDRAVDVLQKAVEAAPQHKGIYIAYLNALFVQGVRLFHRGDYDLSRQMLQFLQNAGAQSTSLQLYLAKDLKELGHYEEALAAFLDARKSSQDPVITFQIVDLLIKLGQMQKAKEEWQSLSQVLPEGWNQASAQALEQLIPLQYLKDGQTRKALFYARQALQKDPGNPQHHLVLAEAYRLLGQREKAVNHFLQAQKKLPDPIGPSFGLLMTYWEDEKYFEAYEVVQFILKKAPQDSTALYYQALLAYKVGQDSQVTLDLLRQMIHQRGADPFLFGALAEDYLRSDLPELAHGWAQRCLKLMPDHSKAMEILLKTRKDPTEEALGPLLQAYRAKKPRDEAIAREEIQYLIHRKAFPAATQRILEYIAFAKKTPSMMKALAFCYRQQKDFTKAFIIYRDLLHHDPESQEIIQGVVLCLVRLGHTAKAVTFLQKARQGRKPNQHLDYELGMIYFTARDWPKARDCFRRVLEHNPQAWQALEKLSQIYAEEGDTLQAQKFKVHAANLKNRTEQRPGKK